MVYLEYDFKISPLQPATDILIAELGELGFESFVENETGLLAYILKSEWKEGALEELFVFQNPNFEISWSQKEIEQQNWNAEWEKNFHPIIVGDRCMVRAPFHEATNVEYDIIIEPKMSFGTGHHETTHMMLQHILDNDFDGKSVLDMGCGTGVLAILAKKRGAGDTEAIDIDEWCFLNTQENVERNGCSDIKAFQGDSSLLEGKKYDVILANINRNILLEDISVYANCLKKNGSLFLSGFYLEDLDAISSKCGAYGLEFEKNLEKNNWVAAKYVNQIDINSVNKMSTREKELEDVLLEEETTNEHEIVLFNDDVNTFDHVITTLINVCEHTPEQAEQCSLIVHYKGKCTVKTGEYSFLEPKCSKLLQAGLSAEIVQLSISHTFYQRKPTS